MLYDFISLARNRPIYRYIFLIFSRSWVLVIPLGVLLYSAKANGFDKGYCTWYAAEQFNENSPAPGVNWRGHAGNWLVNADSSGWLISVDPYDAEAGSLIVWIDSNNNTGVQGYGHVAVVDSVDLEEKKISVSEMNWGPLDPNSSPQEAKTVNFDLVTTKLLSLNELNRAGRVSKYEFKGYIFPRLKNFRINDLLNAKYGEIVLVDGEYKKGDPWSDSNYINVWVHKNKQDDYFVAFGDLDGDGKRDAVVTTYENYGGSGSFLSINVFINKKGRPHFIGAVKLGQKSIKSLKVIGKMIRAVYLKHGPNDPMCCPTILEDKEYEVIGEKIISLY
ncbi:MAG: CHAP domain-containing protein [Candidatus Brocadiales bacterium]|uniref:CHAP domain containing protein n=1 Tax=Chlorobium phaeobacteroides (strain BS1) TaxID=331678 RepID=B3EJW7_CHLPB|nr:CHAP domain-containing protein [Candidatus Brocadiales bacterium]